MNNISIKKVLQLSVLFILFMLCSCDKSRDVEEIVVEISELDSHPRGKGLGEISVFIKKNKSFFKRNEFIPYGIVFYQDADADYLSMEILIISYRSINSDAFREGVGIDGYKPIKDKQISVEKNYFTPEPEGFNFYRISQSIEAASILEIVKDDAVAFEIANEGKDILILPGLRDFFIKMSSGAPRKLLVIDYDFPTLSKAVGS